MLRLKSAVVRGAAGVLRYVLCLTLTYLLLLSLVTPFMIARVTAAAAAWQQPEPQTSDSAQEPQPANPQEAQTPTSAADQEASPTTQDAAPSTPESQQQEPISAQEPQATAAAAPPDAAPKRGHRPKELLVRFHPGVSDAGKTQVIETKGGRRKKKLKGQSHIEKIELPADKDLQAVAAELRQQPAVALAEPNYLVTRDEKLPDDPRFAEQWALKNTGQTNGLPGADIQVTEAWQRTTGKKDTVVAIIDSGVDFTHTDLKNNQWTNRAERKDNKEDDDGNGFVDDQHGWDWVKDSNVIKDENGHGTAMAGIIAAEGDNRTGISGVLWRASLMSLRVLDNTGTGDVADAVEAIDYAVAHGAQVINCSWGTDQAPVFLREAIARANQYNVVVVCSAGNDGRNLMTQPYYPASFGLPNLLVVAATDHVDNLAVWSNRSPQQVQVAAPGTDILTTKMGGGYQVVSGTSAAAPLAVGVAGLVKTARSWLNAADTIRAIVEGARQVPQLTNQVASSGVVSGAGALGVAAQLHPLPGRPSLPLPPGPAPRPVPTPSRGAPNGMRNLNELRNLPPTTPRAPTPIRANRPVCDLDCGGGEPPPGSGSDPDLSTARTLPENKTGQPGVNLGSRNFNWSLPLLSLPGRAGMNLNLTLTYNSLVWTKQDSTIRYNAEHGFPGPGFRLGLPTIQQRYYNSRVGGYAHMLVNPDGSRVELRQQGTSNVYESADNRHTRLEVRSANDVLVRTTDGMQYVFVRSANGVFFANGEWRCASIKDRNGNFIRAEYNTLGRPTTIVDTLGRTVTFKYDANRYLTSITQVWNGQEHDWATFDYGELYIQVDFSGLTIEGPNNRTIPVLTQVGLHDGSRHNFDYTNWGQVYRINRHAPDGTPLAKTFYNLPGDLTPHDDCPRFTERRDWVKLGVMDNDAEVTTRYRVAGDDSWSEVEMPDGTVYKEYFVTQDNWAKGLTIRTETIADGVVQKWTEIDWDQDGGETLYQTNARPSETRVRDAQGNYRRTRIEYTSYGLPRDVYEYGAGGENLYRRTHTEYQFDNAFIQRWIIGLVAERTVYDGGGAVQSKLTYGYDWGGEHMTATPAEPTNHDPAYHAGFIGGRGNLTQVGRWDATDPGNIDKTFEVQKIGYDTAGSVKWSRDAAGHQTEMKYDDNFSAGGNRNTFAYPQWVRDGDGNWSRMQYSYDHGQVTRQRIRRARCAGWSTTRPAASSGLGRRRRTTATTSATGTRRTAGGCNNGRCCSLESRSIRVRRWTARGGSAPKPPACRRQIASVPCITCMTRWAGACGRPTRRRSPEGGRRPEMIWRPTGCGRRRAMIGKGGRG